MGIYLAIGRLRHGYSSLAYLKHFPLDRLKIDKSFINDILTDPDDAAITEAIIAMAHSLKLKVMQKGLKRGSSYSSLKTEAVMRCRGTT